MRSYATITTGRTLRRLYRAGWGVFITADALDRNGPAFRWARSQSPPMPFAIDNGAWSAHLNDREWEPDQFRGLLGAHGEDADFTVIPDIVAGGAASLRRSLAWIPEVLAASPVALLAVQNGIGPADVAPLLSRRVGLFVGGDTEWKISTIQTWAALGRQAGSWVHVGRVNTVNRVNMCTNAGVTSIDGTSVSRFVSNLPKLDGARRQMTLLGDE